RDGPVPPRHGDGRGHGDGDRDAGRDPRQQAGAGRLPGQLIMADPCIEFEDVVAGYGEFMILNNLSFAAKRGKITLLLGPNGAGKSTVLKTLFGLLKVRQGKVRLDGRDITGASAKELL